MEKDTLPSATVSIAFAVVFGSVLISATLLWCSHEVEHHLKEIDGEMYSVKHRMDDIDRNLGGISRDIPSSIEKSMKALLETTLTVKVVPKPNPADKKAELERLLAKVKRSHAEIDAIINSPEFVENRQEKILAERKKIREAMNRLEVREKTE